MLDKLKPCPICGSEKSYLWVLCPPHEEIEDDTRECESCGFYCRASNWNTLPCQELSELEREVLDNVLVQPDDNCEYSVITVPWIEREDGTDVYTIQILSRPKTPAWKVGMGFNFGSGYFQVINAMDQGYAVIDEKATTVFCFNEWAELIEEYYNPTPIKQADLMSTIATRAQEV